MTTRHVALCCLAGLFALPGGVSIALAGDNFPGEAPDRGLIRTQQKVDRLFEKGDYERAMFIYRHELVPLGDKFAQYMVGYMHLAGKGTAQDPAAASAWYRLAAERGHVLFEKARDEVWAVLDDGHKAESDRLYRDLRSQYSDVILVAGLIERDLGILERRVPSNPMASNVLESSFDNRNLSPRQYDKIEKQLADRMQYLESEYESIESIGTEAVSRYLSLKTRLAALNDASGSVD